MMMMMTMMTILAMMMMIMMMKKANVNSFYENDVDEKSTGDAFFMKMKTHFHSCRAWPMFAGSQMHEQN